MQVAARRRHPGTANDQSNTRSGKARVYDCRPTANGVTALRIGIAIASVALLLVASPTVASAEKCSAELRTLTDSAMAHLNQYHAFKNASNADMAKLEYDLVTHEMDYIDDHLNPIFCTGPATKIAYDRLSFDKATTGAFLDSSHRESQRLDLNVAYSTLEDLFLSGFSESNPAEYAADRSRLKAMFAKAHQPWKPFEAR